MQVGNGQGAVDIARSLRCAIRRFMEERILILVHEARDGENRNDNKTEWDQKDSNSPAGHGSSLTWIGRLRLPGIADRS